MPFPILLFLKKKLLYPHPDVKGMSKEALLLITKSAELVTQKLGMETVKVAALQNRRKLLPADIASICTSRECFLFLQQDVQDLQHEMQQEKMTKVNNNANTTATTTNNNYGKPLTDYFSAKKQQQQQQQ
jgi:hypothetical protein